jgi:hypothetical protein
MFSTVNMAFEVRRDPACQSAGQQVGEIAWRMAGQMTEQVAADIAGYPHKGFDPDPARKPAPARWRRSMRALQRRSAVCLS